MGIVQVFYRPIRGPAPPKKIWQPLTWHVITGFWLALFGSGFSPSWHLWSNLVDWVCVGAKPTMWLAKSNQKGGQLDERLLSWLANCTRCSYIQGLMPRYATPPTCVGHPSTLWVSLLTCVGSLGSQPTILGPNKRISTWCEWLWSYKDEL